MSGFVSFICLYGRKEINKSVKWGKDIRICKYAVYSSEILVNKERCPTSQSLK